jgi:hypothetical protein
MLSIIDVRKKTIKEADSFWDPDGFPAGQEFIQVLLNPTLPTLVDRGCRVLSTTKPHGR